jgi:hypothetical protein
MNGKCALCNKDRKLKSSHIIPKFVFSWLKDSASSAIRMTFEPNKRVQDGEKQNLLCSDCEELFGKWGKKFCEQVFIPLHNDSTNVTRIRYGAWALKFAVSVSWRVLLYYYKLNDISHFSERQRDMAQRALEVWRGFLLGELQSPEQFEQHLLPIDAIDSHPGLTISPFLNRYLLRSIHMDVICSKKSAYVYTKMGHLILFGFIQEKNPKRWSGTKMHVNKGVIMPRTYCLPQTIADYLNAKADGSAKSLASTSLRQQQIIQKSIYDNVEEFIDSEIFRAMQYDVYHSGEKAFKLPKQIKIMIL